VRQRAPEQLSISLFVQFQRRRSHDFQAPLS
jgi:hypothetical protein